MMRTRSTPTVRGGFSARRLVFAAGAAAAIGAPTGADAATFSWLSATSGNWNTSNWSSPGFPNDPSDDAVIDAIGALYTVTLNVNPSINTLAMNSTDANFSANGRTLTVNSASLMAGFVQWTSSAWNGGTLWNQAVFNVLGNSSIGAVLTNTGTLNITGAPGFNSGLTLAEGASNTGTINATSTTVATANITVGGAGAFTNDSGGTINIERGSGGGRTYSWNLTNNGTIHVNSDATFARVGGQYTNNGLVTVGAGDSLTYNGSSQLFTQSAGALDIDPTGTFEVINAGFTFDGGSINGEVLFTGNGATSTLNLLDGSTGQFRLRGSTALNGDIQSGQTVIVRGEPSFNSGVTTEDGLTNSGTLSFTSTTVATANLTASGSGAFINSPGGQINIERGSGGGRVMSWNLTNNGTVNVNADAVFARIGGQYLNNGSFNVGSGDSLTYNGSGQLFTQNAGLLSIDATGTLEAINAGFTVQGGTVSGEVLLTGNGGTSTLNLLGGSTGSYRLRGSTAINGDIAAGQIVTVRGEPSFNSSTTSEDGVTNSGTLNFNSTTVATANLTGSGSGGFINNATGVINIERGSGGGRTMSWNLTNNGAVNVNADATFARVSGWYTNNGSFNVGAGDSLTYNGSGQLFSQNAGTLTIDPTGTLEAINSGFTHSGGTVAGEVLLTGNGGTSTLNLLGGSTGSYRLRGSTAINGDIAAGQTVTVRGEPSFNSSTTSEDGVTNSGTLRFDSTTFATANLTGSGAGAFINNAGGQIVIERGIGGGRTMSWNLTNNGAVTVNADATFARVGGQYANNGSFNVGAGDTLNYNGSGQLFSQNAGTLTVDPTGTFEAINAGFTHQGGTVVGEVLLTGNGGTSTLNLTGGTTGAYRLRGTTAITGTIASGQSVTVRGEPSYNSSVTTTDALVNSGSLTLTSVTFATANLSAGGGGSFVNSASGAVAIQTGSGGARVFSAALSNAGLFNAAASQGVSLGRAGAAHSNSGQFVITEGTVTVTGSSFTNQAAGVISGVGNLSTAALAAGLQNDGTISPGLSIGTLTLTGALQNSSTSSLAVEIGGLAPGQFDVLSVSGAAALSGRVAVSLLGGYTPALGDTFRIMNYGSRLGQFGQVLTVAGNTGVSFEAQYSGAFMTIVVTAIPSPAPATVLGAFGLIAVRRRR